MEALAIETCGTNDACLWDYYATGDPSLAATSRSAETGFEDTNNLLSKSYFVNNYTVITRTFPFQSCRRCHVNVMVSHITCNSFLSHLPWTKWPPFRRRRVQIHFLE